MLLGPSLLIITVGFVGFGLYVDRVEYRNRVADIDEELVRAAAARGNRARSIDPPRSPGASSLPVATGEDLALPDGVRPPVELVVTSAGAVVDSGGEPNPFDQTTVVELARFDGFRSVANPRYRVLVNPTADRLIAITALPLDGVDAAVSDFRRALGVGGAVIVVLQGIAVWLVTSRLVQPVTRMTRAATLVADGALDTQIGPPSGSRETAELAIDLDRMLIQLRTTLVTSEQSAADAHRARDDMHRFLADVSHEIRTPLTALRGYSDLYAQGMLGQPGQLDRAMRRVGEESDRLHGLVTNMLRLARHGASAQPVELFDVAVVVADVVADLRSAHPDRVIELRDEPSAEYCIVGSAGEVHQAVLNLGSNACIHTSGPDAIEIALQSTDRSVTIEVVDHGPGIDRQHAERIFLPFFRVDSSRTRGAGGGAGLGLALTKQIADRHQGTVAVSTTPGGGATFRLTLPRPATSPIAP